MYDNFRLPLGMMMNVIIWEYGIDIDRVLDRIEEEDRDNALILKVTPSHPSANKGYVKELFDMSHEGIVVAASSDYYFTKEVDLYFREHKLPEHACTFHTIWEENEKLKSLSSHELGGMDHNPLVDIGIELYMRNIKLALGE